MANLTQEDTDQEQVDQGAPRWASASVAGTLMFLTILPIFTYTLAAQIEWLARGQNHVIPHWVYFASVALVLAGGVILAWAPELGRMPEVITLVMGLATMICCLLLGPFWASLEPSLRNPTRGVQLVLLFFPSISPLVAATAAGIAAWVTSDRSASFRRKCVLISTSGALALGVALLGLVRILYVVGVFQFRPM